MRKASWLSLLLIVGTALPGLAAVGAGYTFFGSATFVTPGHNSNRAVKLVADVAGGKPFSGIDYAVPAGLTVNDLDQLGTEYFFPTGSTCKDGSPRFQINVDHDNNPSTESKNIFVYIGPPPSYTGCPANVWSNTGNLLTPASLVDASQLGGTFYQSWASVQAAFGTLTVTGIQLVADEFSGLQTTLIDNTNINGTLYDYEFASANDCKKGGYQNFTFAPGPFKNQGQCVSHFAKQK